MVSKRFNICLVVPYFGEFPNYFQLFLKSCEKNYDIHWLIITDNDTNYLYPKNVKKIKMEFNQFKKKIQEKFDFKISLPTPKKLCDYKPAYGYILEEYLENYDFWGHCDIDVIYGDLRKFITDKMLIENDKIFCLGHLSLYRNNEDINRIFMKSLNGAERYKDVFSISKNCSFDEGFDKSINEIIIQEDIPYYGESSVADIGPFNYSFCLSTLKPEYKRWFRNDEKYSIFNWKNGLIQQIYINKKELVTKEYSYIHLQKRKMKNNVTNLNSNLFYIVPNKFIEFKEVEENKYINLYKLKCLIDYKMIYKKINNIKWIIISLCSKVKKIIEVR